MSYKTSILKTNSNTRVLAIQVILDVLVNGKSLSGIFTERLDTLSDLRDKSLLQELVYGVIRWYIKLDAILSSLLKKPVKPKDMDVKVTLLLGLYQLLYTRIPDHAAVSATVDSVRILNKKWAVGFVNGVLRQGLRRKTEFEKTQHAELSVRFSHPQWLVEAIDRSWPEHAELILKNNNLRAPMCLRVNKTNISRTDYQALLKKKGLGHHTVAVQEAGVELETAIEVGSLPGYEQGLVSVQDNAAQRVAPLLNLQPSLQVLEVCAAPGGKSAHILELCPQLKKLVMVDINPQRMEVLRTHLQRLGFTQLKVLLEYIVMDALQSHTQLKEYSFDRILVDAPCSATGVIRRHPDIKHLRQQRDIEKLVKCQQELLASVWPLLRPGGQLLYTTCSVLKQENSEQIERFLQNHDDAVCMPIKVPWGVESGPGRQLFPGEQSLYGLGDDNNDGFYFASIERKH